MRYDAVGDGAVGWDKVSSPRKYCLFLCRVNNESRGHQPEGQVSLLLARDRVWWQMQSCRRLRLDRRGLTFQRRRRWMEPRWNRQATQGPRLAPVCVCASSCRPVTHSASLTGTFPVPFPGPIWGNTCRSLVSLVRRLVNTIRYKPLSSTSELLLCLFLPLSLFFPLPILPIATS